VKSVLLDFSTGMYHASRSHVPVVYSFFVCLVFIHTTILKVQAAVDSGVPTQLSYGFISGYCSGFALKKVGKVTAAVFGTKLLRCLLCDTYAEVLANARTRVHIIEKM
jgi:uncharacterized membrane protein (Fun14 family)